MILSRPRRLNLSIGRRCFVSCPGCYQLFGRTEADLTRILASVRRFVDLGITCVTLSGGDPLTLRGLIGFLQDLRSVGVTDLKLDTVGSGLISGESEIELGSLLSLVDCLGVPLDGWSNESVGFFRTGRPRLFDETVDLLDALDAASVPGKVLINTVAHRHNLAGLDLVLAEVVRHPSVFWWNIFQYTPTDQATEQANAELALAEDAFRGCEDRLRAQLPGQRERPIVVFRSVRSRLGEYLLINSDGQVWLPDERGRTIPLGHLGDGESKLLETWRRVAKGLRQQSVTPPSLLRAG